MNTLQLNYLNPHICHLKLNRPSQNNAFNVEMIFEIPKAIHLLKQNQDLRCIIITGSGKHFSSGIDLQDPVFAKIIESSDIARKSIKMYSFIKEL